MLLHNLSMALSQLAKYKLQTLLSLVGLAVGFTCFALSSLWWRYETTYDSFHPGAENLYIQVMSTDKWVTVHPVTDFSAAIQPSHPLSFPSPSALNLSQHQGLFH